MKTVDITELLAQADLVLAMARLLSPPTPQTSMLAVTDFETLVSQAQLSQQLTDSYRHVWQQLQIVALTDWQAEYVRLFEGATLCPINETGFIRRDKGHILADIMGFYQAFGLKLDEHAHEKADHLVCELEFVALLLVLLAHAQRQQSQEAIQVTSDAFSSFSFDHLGDWITPFCQRLARVSSLALYVQLAQLLEQLWSAIGRCHQLPLAEPAEPVFEAAGTPYECGRV
ncbi:MAG: molecular chaperone TorD family protein [Pseudomonadota bacterium]|nr:molecular chaperone TorD family protein [Pseudomonadota bacterium]